MDDLPDKLRRNVVVLSAAIVAITVFHLSFKPTGTLLGFAEVGNITPLKVWIALTAVLAYVFLRYWFHDETDQELIALAGHYKNLRNGAIQRCLMNDVRTYFLQRRRQPRWTVGFEALEDDMFAPAYAEFGRPAFVDLKPSVQHSSHSPWSGDVGFTIGVQWHGGQERGLSGGTRYSYRLPCLVAARIMAGSALRTATYSKSAVDLLVPIGLSIVAGAMCVVQIIQAVAA
ncbi:hypothetical protein BL241_03125 [Ralstonia solanacearum]|uniref:Transmembrane protein n=1 Tax=Ralstonia solanacearum TaxID=305 RepID=A0A0S4U1U2_RALSL|nr:hypothetical protein BL241_03125 [Ralstonia solanacearum]CUV16228.1 conserved membrane protein of unknown function [Ralstonia solanacearum]